MALTENSKVGEFAANEGGKAVLDKYIPGLTTSKNWNVAKNLPLKVVMSLPQTGVSEEMKKAIRDALCKV